MLSELFRLRERAAEWACCSYPPGLEVRGQQLQHDAGPSLPFGSIGGDGNFSHGNASQTNFNRDSCNVNHHCKQHESDGKHRAADAERGMSEWADSECMCKYAKTLCYRSDYRKHATGAVAVPVASCMKEVGVQTLPGYWIGGVIDKREWREAIVEVNWMDITFDIISKFQKEFRTAHLQRVAADAVAVSLEHWQELTAIHEVDGVWKWSAPVGEIIANVMEARDLNSGKQEKKSKNDAARGRRSQYAW